MSEPKKLEYTTEELNYRLNLIDENKNLLPYPYSEEIELPEWLEDVGDGSFLMPAIEQLSNTKKDIFLNTCVLPVGKKYTISIEYTTVLDDAITSSVPEGFSLKVVLSDGSKIETTSNGSGLFIAEINLTETGETPDSISISVFLVLPANPASDTEVLIKPQIEEGLEKTPWVPYMKTMGSYVDARFNSTNAKIKVLNDELTDIKNNNSSGSISNVFILSSDTPEDTDDNKKLLWIDTNPTTGGLKYYKEGEGWVTVPVRFS